MIKIDQAFLCEYCKEYHDSNMSMCEGAQCEKMTELYLDAYGITEENPEEKTFANLKIDSSLYLLETTASNPEIKTVKINSLTMWNDDPLTISYESSAIKIPKRQLKASQYQNIFLSRKEAEQELSNYCQKRIVELSKVIGSIER